MARLRLSHPNSVPRSEEGEEVLALGMDRWRDGRPADEFLDIFGTKDETEADLWRSAGV